jgi:peptidoglycan hydrolase FlgJ
LWLHLLMDLSRQNSQIGSVASGLAADSRSLEQLKRAARDDPRQAVKKVAGQFEALFVQMVLKSMREATMRSGLLDSQEQDLYRGMLDQQVAQQVAAQGTGLADLIARQLSRNLPSGPAAGQAAAPAAADSWHAAPPATAAPVPAAPAPSGSPAAAPPAEAPSPSDAGRRDFMQKHWADALRAQHLTGVPASFILGQAALESGWGRREIMGADGQSSHNLFGIKAGPGWQGRTVQAATTEVVGGVARKSVESFRAYDSYAAAFQDWALSIGRNRRYAAAVVPGAGAGGFALGMQQAGYSTDPAYGEKLARVIRTASSLRGAV